MSLFLGLDSSTQSLSAIVIEVTADGERRVAFEHSLRFDSDLSEYGTQNGVIRDDDPLVAHSSPRMWADALDRMLGVLARESGLDLSELRAIAGSGQQHGSVYLNASAPDVLRSLDPSKSLAQQLGSMFSRATSPIWMDSSTGRQCEEITAAVGGADRLAQLTGSRAFERFTGPQIRKFWQQDPTGWDATDRVHLVSSYAATLLAGTDAPIDPGDGAGMNLMDLVTRDWSPAAMDATAPGLAEKLPPIADSWHIVGTVAPYWRDRHGLSADTHVVAWSGDNPCSLIGVGLVKPGRVAISLGTSDTLFGFMPDLHVDTGGIGHVFGSPTGEYMSLICFKNGSLARERIRKDAGLEWDQFSQMLRDTPAGNGGRVILPWFEAEITPHAPQPGAHRYRLEADDKPANVRAVIEAQMLSTALHSEWMGVDVDTIHATGGASANREILQVMADVHGAVVFQLEVGNSAALGAALRAFHAAECERGNGVSWDDITRGFVEPAAGGAIRPRADCNKVYNEMRELYRLCEEHALGRGDDPTPKLAEFGRRHG